MKRRNTIWTAWLALVATATAWAAGINLPICTTPPRLDADLDDAGWQTATKLTGFHKVLRSADARAQVQTTVWLCRDDAWLYVAFRCDEPKAFSVQRAVTERDGKVTLDDSVEIFIDPGTSGQQYAHLMLGAGNAQADRWRDGKRSTAWDLPWRSAARADRDLNTATGWSAELAIPLAPLQRRAGREPWRINCCRSRRTVSPAEYSSLAALPPRSSFHAPEHFLPISGLSGFKANAVFGPMLDGIELQPLRIEAGRQFYELEVGLAELGGLAGRVEVVVQDEPKSGRGRRATETVKLWRRGKRKVRLQVQVPDLSPRSAWVGLRKPGADLWLVKTSVSGLDALSPLDAYLDRDYYTTEAAARVHAAILLDKPARQGAGVALRVSLGDRPQGQVACDAAEVALPIDLAAVPLGAHTVNVSLVNREGRPLGSARLTLIKRALAEPGANELKIDRHRRCLLLNGKPFFPMGTMGRWYRGRFEGHVRELFERQFGYCRAAGFNILVDWAGYGPDTPLEDVRAQYDLALANGIMVIGKPYQGACRKEGWIIRYSNPKFRDAARRVIDHMDSYLEFTRTHPAVIAYYHLDEPQPWLHIDDLLIEVHDKIRRVCPHLLVYMSLTRYIDNPSWFDRTADLLGAHNYWYVDRPDTLPAQSDWFLQVDGHARRAHSPTMHVGILQCSGDFTIANATEQRAQTYLMLVANARSVIYFVLPFTHPNFVQTQGVISNEVLQLAPALMTRDLPQKVTFEPETAYVPKGSSARAIPVVQTLLKRHPDGGQLLLAVNSCRQPVDVKFTVSTLGADSTVQRMFGDRRRRDAAERSFSDTLEPLGTRAYRLTHTALPTRDAPAAIHLAMSGPAVAREPAAEPVDANVLANAGFEDEGGWREEHLNVKAHGRWGKLERSTDQPHSGHRCLKIVRTKAEGMADVVSDPVTLERGKTYRFGGWLRSELTEVGRWLPKVFVHSARGRKLMASATMKRSQDQGWVRIESTVTAPQDADEVVRFWCRVRQGCLGATYYDDLFICEAMAGPTKPKNLLSNSSFETACLPGQPTSWESLAWGRLMPDERTCGQDDRNPCHGRYCMRVTRPADAVLYDARTIHAPMSLVTDETYTLSAYLRADKPGVRAFLYLGGCGEVVKLTTQWQRYTLTKTIDNGAKVFVAVYYGSPAGSANAYVDAVQVELGDAATDYEAN